MNSVTLVDGIHVDEGRSKKDESQLNIDEDEDGDKNLLVSSSIVHQSKGLLDVGHAE